MDDGERLAERFEEHRTHLRGIAYRMLGSLSEAEDAVQETWLRLSSGDVNVIENLGGWLTTVVARVCLNVLRSRGSRREEPLEAVAMDPVGGADPADEAVLADSVGLAMLVVLDTLAPAERIAFVLHDMFAVPFEDIGPMLDRSAATARQLASRARRRIRGVEPAPEPDLIRQRRVVDAFLAASRGGDFDALVALLDPDVLLRADAAAGPTPQPILLRGARRVGLGASAAAVRIPVTTPALINGRVGLVMAPLGRLALVLDFTIVDDRITEMDVIAEPERLRSVTITVLDG